jgi:hypothetical protein
MKDTIIGLYSPYPGAGKSTVAQQLIEMGGERVKFAGCLKDMLRSCLAYQGATEEEIERMIEGDLKEQSTSLLCGRTPRHALQTIGTEWGRNLIGNDMWLNTTQRKIDQTLKSGKFVVIDDLRFENEYYFLEAQKARHVVLVRIFRPGLDYTTSHASEGALEHLHFDMSLRNAEKTAEDFGRRAAHFISSYVESELGDI